MQFVNFFLLFFWSAICHCKVKQLFLHGSQVTQLGATVVLEMLFFVSLLFVVVMSVEA